jgi:hypothetical protein
MAAQDRSSQSTQQQQQQPPPQQQQPQNAKAGQPGRQTSSGQPSETQNGSSGGGESGQQMRDVSEAMRSATNDLRRQDPRQATTSGSRALDKLRDLERQLQAAAPDEQRRALGELQLEARQLADSERQVASELGKTERGEAGRDQVRRLAGEQQRLAERARSLEQMLKQQGGSRGTDPRGRAKASEAEAQSASTRAAAAEGAKELERDRLADRMQQSADAMRAEADRAPAPQRGNAASPPPSDGAKGQVGAQQEMARALDKLAERLSSALGATDGESRKLSDLMTRAQQLREKIDDLTGQLKQLAQRNAAGQRQGAERGQSRGASQTGSASTPGETGRTGRGQQGGGGGSGIDLARLRDDYQRALQETRDLLEQMRRDDPGSQTFARGGAGFTFEGQGMTLSAPGTEAFKQDFAKWDDLRHEATQALEAAETAISRKLQAKQAKDRLAAGAEDKAPAEYQKQVDEYFKAIAKKKGR